MKKLVTLCAAGILVAGTMATMSLMARAEVQAPSAANFHAALVNSSRIVTEVSCRGTTGIYGCGPGWYWRHGWKGWACYRC
jgi:hypothetical protein